MTRIIGSQQVTGLRIATIDASNLKAAMQLVSDYGQFGNGMAVLINLWKAYADSLLVSPITESNKEFIKKVIDGEAINLTEPMVPLHAIGVIPRQLQIQTVIGSSARE